MFPWQKTGNRTVWLVKNDNLTVSWLKEAKWAGLSTSYEELPQHMKKKLQRRRRTDTFHIQKIYLSPFLQQVRPSIPYWLSMLFVKLKDLLQSHLISELRDQTISALVSNTLQELSWKTLTVQFLQRDGPHTGSRRDGQTRTAHLSGSYHLCT